MTRSVAQPGFDVDRLLRLGRVAAVAPAPCGTWLAVAVARLNHDESAYVSDLWRVSLVDPTCAPVRLTWGESHDVCPRFRGDGSLGFLRIHRQPGEPARPQVWLLPALGGEARPITDEPLGVRDFRFARTGERLFVLADVLPGVPHEEQRARAENLARRGPTGLRYTSMPVRHWDSWLPMAAPHVIVHDHGQRRDLTPAADREHREADVGVIHWDVAPDGSRVAVAALRMGSDRGPDSAIRLIDVATGAAVELGALDRTSHTMLRFDPAGQRLACVRAWREIGRAERQGLWLFELASLEHAAGPGSPDARTGRAMAPGWDAWPSLHAWTPDGLAVIATADHGGHVPVFRVDVSSGEVTRLTAERVGGSHGDLHVTLARGPAGTGAAIVGIRHGLLQPQEPFRMDLVAAAEPALLANLSGFTAEQGAALATWEHFTIAGDQGTPVHSFVVRPRAAGPHPALLWIHGGPMTQHADAWHWRWNALVAVAAGYAVILPNPRGSTGFGQEFIQGVWNNTWGGACYRDLMAVADAMYDRADIDAGRMAAMGGSFGGYMASWIGGNTDRFRCLVTHAGVSAMSMFVSTTDVPAYFHYMMQQTPYDDFEGFDRHSPHRRVQHWKTPTLIIHGEKDYRVPVSEALVLFEALQTRGVDAELLIFPDENHWILRPQNIRQWYQAVLEFADRHLEPA